MSLRTRSPLPLQELNLRDEKTVHALIEEKSYSCEHGTFHFECHLCWQNKIKKFMGLEPKTAMWTSTLTHLAICSYQFAFSDEVTIRPLPLTIEIETYDRHECKTMEEARKYVSKDKYPDEELQKRLDAGKTIILQLRTAVKKMYPVDAKGVDHAITQAQIAFPRLLKKLNEAFEQSEYLDPQALEDLDHAEILKKVIECFRFNKKSYEEFAKRCQLPIEIITDIVLPRALALEAKKYLITEGKELYDRFPPMKRLLFFAESIYLWPHLEDSISPAPFTLGHSEEESSPEPFTLGHSEEEIKFSDKCFPTYEANRIVHPESRLARVRGPRKSQELTRMLENTVFNPDFPLDQLVVIADQLQDVSKKPDDLINYCLLEPGSKILATQRVKGAVSSEASERVAFEISVLENDGDLAKLKRPLGTDWAQEDKHSATIKLQVKKIATDEVRVLTVHFFKNPAGSLLDHIKLQDFQRLFNVFSLAQTRAVGLQSSKSSAESVGVLVFGFELAKFLKANADKINSFNINKCLIWVAKNITSYNPGLINPTSFVKGANLGFVLFSHEKSLKQSLELLTSSGPLERHVGMIKKDEATGTPKTGLDTSHYSPSRYHGSSVAFHPSPDTPKPGSSAFHPSPDTPRPGAAGKHSFLASGHIGTPRFTSGTPRPGESKNGLFSHPSEGSVGRIELSSQPHGVNGVGTPKSAPASGELSGSRVLVASGHGGPIITCKGVVVQQDYGIAVDPSFADVAGCVLRRMM